MRREITPDTQKQLETLFIDEQVDNPSGLAAKVMQLLGGETPEPASPAARAAINPAMKAHCKNRGLDLETFASTWVRTYPRKAFR